MKNKFWTGLSIIIIIILQASMLHSQGNPEMLVEDFFVDYQKKGASTALDNLYSTNEWMNRATDAITNIKSQLEGLNEDFVGKYFGYELILERKLSESYKLLSYLVKYDRQPLRFTFQFYKPNDKWVIQSFQFDGDLDEEIEESAKLYYLNLDE